MNRDALDTVGKDEVDNTLRTNLYLFQRGNLRVLIMEGWRSHLVQEVTAEEDVLVG